MKKCRHCMSEMDEKANVCPTCRKSQKNYLLALLLIILGLWLWFSGMSGMLNN